MQNLPLFIGIIFLVVILAVLIPTFWTAKGLFRERTSKQKYSAEDEAFFCNSLDVEKYVENQAIAETLTPPGLLTKISHAFVTFSYLVGEVFYSCMGRLGQWAFSYPRGEESQRFVEPEVLEKLLPAFDNILRSAQEGSRSDFYESWANFVHIIVYRGLPSPDFENDNLNRFIGDLEDCVKYFAADDPAGARPILQKWHQQWKKRWYEIDESDKRFFLPKCATPPAIAAVVIGLQVYGDTYEWIRTKDHKEDNKTTKETLEKLLAALRNKDSRAKLDCLCESINLVPAHPL